MAKALSHADAYKQMYDQLTPEERAIIDRMTGKAQVSSGNRAPVIRVNYQERTDLNGKTVPKGNFVLGQRLGNKDGKQVLEEAGTDLGTSLEVILLKIAQQYSFIAQDKDPKKRCSSQMLTEDSEVPVGFNLGNVCNDKENPCTRRADGVGKNDKCSCQYVAFVRLPKGTKLPDGTEIGEAMMYVKGESFMPFKDYVDKELKAAPAIFSVTTKFSLREEFHDSVKYFVLEPSLGKPIDPKIFRELFEAASAIAQEIEDYKASRKEKDNKPKIQRGTSGQLLPPGEQGAPPPQEPPAAGGAFSGSDDDLVF